jgi:hypothetical protein
MAGNKTLALIIPCCALAVACFPEERMVQQYDDVLPAEGLTSLHVVMGSGDLRIEGREGLDEIRVEVRVFTQLADCDGDAEVLDDVDVDDDWMAYWADVTVYAPAALALDVRDTNGDIDISDFASLVLDDENGDTTIERIAGDVEIEDGNGDMDLRFIDGDVVIDDGTGDIDVRDVTGTVTIHDGSGDIHAENVGDLEVIEDASGDIDWD